MIVRGVLVIVVLLTLGMFVLGAVAQQTPPVDCQQSLAHTQAYAQLVAQARHNLEVQLAALGIEAERLRTENATLKTQLARQEKSGDE